MRRVITLDDEDMRLLVADLEEQHGAQRRHLRNLERHTIDAARRLDHIEGKAQQGRRKAILDYLRGVLKGGVDG